MSDKVLFVDDEPAALDGYRRTLRQEFAVTTAIGAELGLASIETDGPYSVVISDMRMPGMNGAEFLAAVREKNPTSVRMLLTGHADLDAAIQAVNQGNIFRFLTKPCEKGVLVEAINSGLTQYHAIMADKELVKKAQLVAKSSMEWDAEDLADSEAFEGAAGLPGPERAKSYLQSLIGADHQTYVVLIKLSQLHTIETRHGEDAAADYINGAALFMVNAFRPTDRFFQWNKDVLIGVLKRQMPAAAVRMEVARLTSGAPQQIVDVDGRKVMLGVSTTFDLLLLSLFPTLDELFTAFNAKLIGTL